MSIENMPNHMIHDGESDDGEGVWSADMERCFREALALYPPCGRRKSILPEEQGGKHYGRNELIARYIKLKTGKSRTRKQVSSHIQVLARRKAKAQAANSSGPNDHLITSETILGYTDIGYENYATSNQQNNILLNGTEIWMDRPVVTNDIRLVKFSAFIEHQQRDNISALNYPGHNQNAQHNQPHQQHHNYHYSPSHQDPRSNQTNGSGFMSQTNTDRCDPGASNANYNYLMANQQLFNNNNHNHNNNINHLDQDDFRMEEQQQTKMIRHCYINIDYSSPELRLANQTPIETININLIHDKFPELGATNGLIQRAPANACFLIKCWADLSMGLDPTRQDCFFGYSTLFETMSSAFRELKCSTKVCSYGSPLVEKVERVFGIKDMETGLHRFNVGRSPMCSFMVEFIRKLQRLPALSLMNNVLENFTVLQTVTSEPGSELLLCLAYVFEISPHVASNTQRPVSQFNVYKLIKD